MKYQLDRASWCSADALVQPLKKILNVYTSTSGAGNWLEQQFCCRELSAWPFPSAASATWNAVREGRTSGTAVLSS